MNDNLSKTTTNMAIVWGVFFSLNALGSCILAAFVNASWEDMGGAKKVLLFIAIFTNWTAMMMAFFSKTIARLENGKPFIPANDTNTNP